MSIFLLTSGKVLQEQADIENKAWKYLLATTIQGKILAAETANRLILLPGQKQQAAETANHLILLPGQKQQAAETTNYSTLLPQ